MSRWFRIGSRGGGDCSSQASMRVCAQSPFPSKARAYFRALCGRRRRRYPGAHAGRCGLAAMGPGRRGREPARERAAWSPRRRSWQSPPDGYTLIVVASGHATNPFLYPEIALRHLQGFHADFAVGVLAESPAGASANSPFKTLADVIARANAKPGSLSFGHAGNGTSTHLAGELLKNLAGIDIQAIPYKGGAARDQRSPGWANSRCPSTTGRNR